MKKFTVVAALLLGLSGLALADEFKGFV